MMKYLAAAMVVVFIVASVVVPSLVAQDPTAQQMKDRAEIEALMWSYTRALDGYDPDTYASAYTEDGQFQAGATATKGREALRKMVADLKQRRDESAKKGQQPAPMYHMTMNQHLEFIDKDHARLHAYYLTVFGAAGQQTPLRVAAAGRSVDDLVRVNGKWLIRSRDVAPTTE